VTLRYQGVMELTILGSGGCMVIPKPLCECRVCEEARIRGIPFSRSGPSFFVHDVSLLIDTPAEVASQLNRAGIKAVNYLLLTHLDPDHVEGLRVVEQITLDFRIWKAYPDKRIRLLAPRGIRERIGKICSSYGPLIDFYVEQGFLEIVPFEEVVTIGDVEITAVPIDRGVQWVYVYVLASGGRRVVCAPCDIKPFPEERPDVQAPDLLLIQPGIFETGLKHGFVYPENHVSRSTLYTFDETTALARRIGARETVFVHLEEYWNRSHTDYQRLEKGLDHMAFSYDGMRLHV